MQPMLATPGTQPAGPEWLYEVKWDGMRILADVAGGKLRLFSRNGRDVTPTFPELHELTDFVQDALIDGEIIALDGGVPSFAALAERMHVTNSDRARQLAERQPVTVMTFDLLRLYGVDLVSRPLEERRASLAKLALPQQHWRHSPGYDDGPALFAATREQGLEGVVAKRRRSTYQPGRRSADWVKTAHRHTQTCLVGGWRPQTGTSGVIGSLLIGVPEARGSLEFVGRVGSGISGNVSRDLRRALTPLHRIDSPFSDVLARGDSDGATWCRPRVVIEVRHAGWTNGGRLRHPVFRGIRSDLDPADVRREP